MSETQKNATDFIAYEYKTVKVRRNMESIWTDSFKTFGWKLEKSVPAIIKHVWGPIALMVAPLAIFPGTPFRKMVADHKSETEVELKFKRDRALPKKAELNRLQSQFESHAGEIDNLETSKTSTATAVAYIVGLIGVVFMAFSVFSYLAGMLYFCILMAVPGFAAWILSYFIYQAVKGSRIKKVAPLIEQQYDSIYNVCAKADEILHPGKTA